MSTLIQRISDLAAAIAVVDKAQNTFINGGAANLNALTTTVKTNLVAAINELKSEIAAVAAQAAGAAVIDDGIISYTETWSSLKIVTEIEEATTALINGAPGALDTLKELSDALGADPNFAATITAALGNRVRTDTASQGLNATMQNNARTNIGAQAAAEIGNPDTDFAAVFASGLL